MAQVANGIRVRPERVVLTQGAGASIVWIEPELELVVVTRGLPGEAVDGFTARVLAALR